MPIFDPLEILRHAIIERFAAGDSSVTWATLYDLLRQSGMGDESASAAIYPVMNSLYADGLVEPSLRAEPTTSAEKQIRALFVDRPSKWRIFPRPQSGPLGATSQTAVDEWTDYLNSGQWQRILRTTKNKHAAHLQEMVAVGSAECGHRQKWRLKVSALSAAELDRYRALVKKLVPTGPDCSRLIPSRPDRASSA